MLIYIATAGIAEIENDEKIDWDYKMDFEREDAYAQVRVKFLGNAGILVSTRFWGYHRPGATDIWFGPAKEIKKKLKEEVKRLRKLGFEEVE